VIVRVATEGQYEIDDADMDELTALDDAAVASCDGEDEQEFQAHWGKLLEFIRTKGRRVDEDHLGGSDLILPPPDVTLAEARAEFHGTGLLPD
jgi:hypothetical protein